MRPTLPLLASVLVVAGCGGADKRPSDAQQVKTVLMRYADALQRHDYDTLCGKVLAPKLLSGIEGIGLPCQQALRRAYDDVKNPQLSADQVKITGDTATARVRTSASGEPPSTDVVQLQQIKGEWRVSALGTGTPAG